MSDATPAGAHEAQVAHMAERLRQFESAIQRIAAHVHACCGGVDTGREIDPLTGQPYGPGGHTAHEICKRIDELLADARKRGNA